MPVMDGLTFLAHLHESSSDIHVDLMGEPALRVIAHELVIAVAQRLSSGIDMTCQGRFRDDSPIPNLVQQVVLAYYMLAVAQEIDQKVKDLRSSAIRSAATGRRFLLGKLERICNWVGVESPNCLSSRYGHHVPCR
jgi:hypothetical protein